MSSGRLVCVQLLILVSCSRMSETDTAQATAVARGADLSPAATTQAVVEPPSSAAPREPPSVWAGVSWIPARSGSHQLSVTLLNREAPSTNAPDAQRPLAIDPPADARSRPEASRAIEPTDIAFDLRSRVLYVGTCCEPGSGHLLRVDANAPAPAFTQDDQGFAVDVAGPSPVFARTDTWGTLAVRVGRDAEPEVQAGAGVADVAVDGAAAATRVIALIDSTRLRALVPTAPAPSDGAPDPGLLVRTRAANDTWIDARYALPGNRTWCRVVPLRDGTIGLLSGTLDPAAPWRCTGDSLALFDTARRQLRENVVKFPAPVQHLSIDESSTYLIFTTTQGAVAWQTLDGRSGMLSARGFAAADW